MKFAAPKPVIWHKTEELNNKFNRTSSRFHKMMVLQNVWDVIVGAKAKFWVLEGVDFNGKTRSAALEVRVTNSSARHGLKVSEEKLLKDLNKYFDKPWLTKIVIK